MKRLYIYWKKGKAVELLIMLFPATPESWDNSFGISTDYGLDGQSSIPGRERSSSGVQTEFGALPASYPLGIEGSFPRSKAAGV
jgi:hypothetical protein